MGTSWNGQINHKEKDFRIQFQTDDYEKYKKVEKLCQELMDSTITDDEVGFVPYNWPDDALMIHESSLTHIPEPCKSCPNHPANGGSGFCNCALGGAPITCSSGYVNTSIKQNLTTTCKEK